MFIQGIWKTAGLTALLVFSCAAASAAEKYQFSIVATSGEVVDGKSLLFSGMDLGPAGLAINDAGEIVFRAGFCIPGQPCSCGSSGCNFGLFRATVAAGTAPARQFVVGTGSVVGGKTLVIPGRPAFNNAGTILYDAIYSDAAYGTGLFTQTAMIAGTGSVIGGKTITGVVHIPPSINDSGGIAFTAFYTDATGDHSGIFSPTQFLAGTGTTVGGIPLTFASGGVLTDDYRLIFTGEYQSGGTVVRGIFTLDGPLVVDDPAGNPPIAINGFGASDYGDVVFQSATVAPALFVLDDRGNKTRLRMIASSEKAIDHTAIALFTSQAINSSGDVVFAASLGTPAYHGGSAVFTPKQRVIGPGDVLAGKTVQGAADPVINDAGRIVCLVGFTDGSQSVVVADPKH